MVLQLLKIRVDQLKCSYCQRSYYSMKKIFTYFTIQREAVLPSLLSCSLNWCGLVSTVDFAFLLANHSISRPENELILGVFHLSSEVLLIVRLSLLGSIEPLIPSPKNIFVVRWNLRCRLRCLAMSLQASRDYAMHSCGVHGYCPWIYWSRKGNLRRSSIFWK